MLSQGFKRSNYDSCVYLKIVKGHQTLCDVLKKQILNQNPRKEGVGFERKMNVDGSY